VRTSLCSFAIGFVPRTRLINLAIFPFAKESPFAWSRVGNLLHLKGFHLGLRAFVRFRHQVPASEYWIIGEGPKELGVIDRVTFWGALPRYEVFEKLAQCDVLVPS
jgi:glycosyltransferase involved in cell wall biosynthesis